LIASFLISGSILISGGNNISNNGQVANVVAAEAVNAPVKINIKGVDLPLQSKIIGGETDKYLIIKTPDPYTRIEHNLFQSEDHLTIKYSIGGAAFTFKSFVIRSIDSPLSLIFIEYPVSVVPDDLREQQRVHCQIPVQLSLKDESSIGCIVDMSRFGCRLTIQKSKNDKLPTLVVNGKVTVKCIFPGSQNSTSLPGVVKNYQMTSDEADVGVAFSLKQDIAVQKEVDWFLTTLSQD